MFPSGVGERLNCGIAVLSEALRCLSDLSSFICPGQKGRERNSTAWPDPARNAGLSGVYMCECVNNAQYPSRHMHIGVNLCLLKDSVVACVMLLKC